MRAEEFISSVIFPSANIRLVLFLLLSNTAAEGLAFQLWSFFLIFFRFGQFSAGGYSCL